MDEYKWLAGFIIMVWATVRWACIVADKVPTWLNEDWKNQAEEFLEYETISPPPNYRWWTPKFLIDSKHHNLYWIPILGPWKDGKRTQAVLEVISIPLSLFLMVLPMEYALFGILFCGFLLALSLIDQRTMLLPDILVYPLMWLGVFKASLDTTNTHLYLMGLLLGFSILFILQQGFKLIRGKDGMGGGDVKFLAAIGVWVGVDLVIPVLFLACALSILLFIASKIFKNTKHLFPFGPSLALSGFFFYFFKPYIDLAA